MCAQLQRMRERNRAGQESCGYIMYIHVIWMSSVPYNNLSARPKAIVEGKFATIGAFFGLYYLLASRII